MTIRSTIFAACATAVLMLAGCEAEPGSERWCSNKAEETAEERADWEIAAWSEYAELCFEQGSKGWCEVQREAPKDDWGLSDVTNFWINCMQGGEAEDEEAAE